MPPKSLVCVCVAVLLQTATVAHAGLVPISGTASVSVSGTAGGGPLNGGGGTSYSHSQSAPAPFTTFNGNVSGEAQWTIPDDRINNPFFLGTNVFASSHSTQISTVSGTGVSSSGSAAAEAAANASYGYVTISASAHSVFDLIFRIDQPMAYTLALHGSAFQHNMFSHPLPMFSLQALGGDFLLEPFAEWDTGSFSGGRSWNYSGVGVLGSGDYRLIHSFQLGSGSDPFGTLHSTQYTMDLRVASIPETGSTVLMLAFSFIVLGAMIGRHLNGRRTRDFDMLAEEAVTEHRKGKT